ncbi:hypothetical protein ZWY2020_018541 [Hordeum vulgare]|nr:hypothetical protein ZWY2020_018541 [Hordeum vulgare]
MVAAPLVDNMLKFLGEGEISEASEEQIRELNRSCSRGGRGGSGGGGSGSEKEDIRPHSITGEKPRYSNKHGRLHHITGDQCPHLRNLDLDVNLVNITRGSMTTLRYTTRATKIVVVVEARNDGNYFEMACPHLSSSGRSERREHDQEREREHGHGRRSEERERGRRSEERGQEHGGQEEEQGHGGEQEKSRGYRQR